MSAGILGRLISIAASDDRDRCCSRHAVVLKVNDRVAVGLEAIPTIVDSQPGAGLAPHGESHGSEHAVAEAPLTHPVQLSRAQGSNLAC